MNTVVIVIIAVVLALCVGFIIFRQSRNSSSTNKGEQFDYEDTVEGGTPTKFLSDTKGKPEMNIEYDEHHFIKADGTPYYGQLEIYSGLLETLDLVAKCGVEASKMDKCWRPDKEATERAPLLGICTTILVHSCLLVVPTKPMIGRKFGVYATIMEQVGHAAIHKVIQIYKLQRHDQTQLDCVGHNPKINHYTRVTSPAAEFYVVPGPFTCEDAVMVANTIVDDVTSFLLRFSREHVFDNFDMTLQHASTTIVHWCKPRRYTKYEMYDELLGPALTFAEAMMKIYLNADPQQCTVGYMNSKLNSNKYYMHGRDLNSNGSTNVLGLPTSDGRKILIAEVNDAGGDGFVTQVTCINDMLNIAARLTILAEAEFESINNEAKLQRYNSTLEFCRQLIAEMNIRVQCAVAWYSTQSLPLEIPPVPQMRTDAPGITLIEWTHFLGTSMAELASCLPRLVCRVDDIVLLSELPPNFNKPHCLWYSIARMSVGSYV